MKYTFDYQSLAHLVKAAEEEKLPISELVLAQQAEQMECTKEYLYEKSFRIG